MYDILGEKIKQASSHEIENIPGLSKSMTSVEELNFQFGIRNGRSSLADRYDQGIMNSEMAKDVRRYRKKKTKEKKNT